MAYSGGADSTALLITLTRLFPELDTRASHINHGVQTEARDWVAHCQALCARLKVPLDVGVLLPPVDHHFAQGFEAWARAGRYAHWQQLLGEADVLLLAHHKTDQEETIALKLLQGRLPLPMPASRTISAPVGAKGAHLLRPWLSQPGTHTRAMLKAVGESWIEDPSNGSSSMLRNRVRNNLLPVLLEEAPGLSAVLERCGALTERLVRNFAGGILASAEVGELLRLPHSALECPNAVLGALIAVAPGASRGVTRSQITTALKQLKRQSDAHRGRADRPGVPLRPNPQLMDEAGPLTLWLADDRPQAEVLVWREPQVDTSRLQLSAQGELEIELAHGWLRLKGTAGLVVGLRTAQSGDRVRMGGKPRPLREVLRHGGVPRWMRASYPLLFKVSETAADASDAFEADKTEILAVPLFFREAIRDSVRDSAGEASPPGATGAPAVRTGDLEASFQIKAQPASPRK